jgi:hypothetical protein
MKYVRTIQEFTNDGITRGIYEGEHDSIVRVIVRRNDRFWMLFHTSDEPKLWDVRDDVSDDFLKQITK